MHQEEDEEERKVEEYLEIGLRLKGYPEVEVLQAKKLVSSLIRSAEEVEEKIEHAEKGELTELVLMVIYSHLDLARRDEEKDAIRSLDLLYRHKCPACFKQYKKKEHLVAHMKLSCHSIHQPKCGVCKKFCQTLESLREHIIGPRSKTICSTIFTQRGCSFCLNIFESSTSLDEHRLFCCLPAPFTHETIKIPGNGSQIDYSDSTFSMGTQSGMGLEAIAIDCEMVEGKSKSDGLLDLCARVCLVDENENPIFHTYVLPENPVTNYRYEITGITEEHLRDGMPLDEVKRKVSQILCNRESIEELPPDGGKARILVGHNLKHDLCCLRMSCYPNHLLRDTSMYQPLMKTNMSRDSLVSHRHSHSLKYLTQTYLGYDIQIGVHDPYQDCVAAMRLYKRMRSQNHPVEVTGTLYDPSVTDVFSFFTDEDLVNMTPDELFEISRPNYRCWCLDSGRETGTSGE